MRWARRRGILRPMTRETKLTLADGRCINVVYEVDHKAPLIDLVEFLDSAGEVTSDADFYNLDETTKSEVFKLVYNYIVDFGR